MERYQMLQEKLVELRGSPRDYLEARIKTLKFWIRNNGEHHESPSPIYRDELRLIEEEIQRRDAKKTSKKC